MDGWGISAMRTRSPATTPAVASARGYRWRADRLQGKITDPTVITSSSRPSKGTSMRVLPARRIASSALCAALLLGIGAPAALAADGAPTRGHAHAAAPVPGADGLLPQVTALAGLGGPLTPVTDLLDTVLTTDHARLSDEETEELGAAAEAAIAQITEEAASVPRSDPAADADGQGSEGGTDATGIEDDPLAKLRGSLDKLLEAVTSGDLGKVVPAATGLVTGLVDVVVSTVVANSTTEPNTSALPDSAQSADLTSGPNLSNVSSMPGMQHLPDSSRLPKTGLLSLLGLGAGA
jgi:hypothetical protein